MTAELSALVDSARAGLAGDTAAAVELARARAGAGAAAEGLDGRVRVVLGADARIRSLSIDPTALREPLEDLLAAVARTIDTARAQLVGTVDVAPAVQMLQAIRDETRAELQALLAGFDVAEAKVGELRSGS